MATIKVHTPSVGCNLNSDVTSASNTSCITLDRQWLA